MTDAEIKKELRESVEALANKCLMNFDTHRQYNEKDLENATLVFMHFLMDVTYSENQNLTEEKQLELATTLGQSIRELIVAATGKDMHQIVKTHIA